MRIETKKTIKWSAAGSEWERRKIGPNVNLGVHFLSKELREIVKSSYNAQFGIPRVGSANDTKEEKKKTTNYYSIPMWEQTNEWIGIEIVELHFRKCAAAIYSPTGIRISGTEWMTKQHQTTITSRRKKYVKWTWMTYVNPIVLLLTND